MNRETLDQILSCLDNKKWVMHYGKDAYSFLLLEFWLKQHGPSHVRTIKQSAIAKLLERPAIKALIAQQPVLDSDLFANPWTQDFEPIVLTLGQWGNEKSDGWNQTSRNGYNLVIQVNLSEQWNKLFNPLFSMTANEFGCSFHPINTERSATLGWVRLDLDFELNEVLIEEVQSDLVRDISRFHRRTKWAQLNGHKEFRLWAQTYNTEETAKALSTTNCSVIQHWQETLLWSALWFCIRELGMFDIYYHTFATGNRLKRINGNLPPRSLYTDLPKKFCFTKTDQTPEMLLRSKEARRRLKAAKQNHFFRAPLKMAN